MAPTGNDLLQLALAQRGKPYVYAAQPPPTVANPPAFDCSGLTRWVAGRLGVYLPAGSWVQRDYCAARGGLITLAQARQIPGALIGHDGQGAQGHIAFVAGTNITMEARGSAYGVNQFPISGRPFQWGLLIPGVNYSASSAKVTAPPNITLGEFDMQLTDVTGHLKTQFGEWLQTADGGIITISGPYLGSYPGLPAQFHDNPNRRFYGPLEARGDGKPGYVLTASDANEKGGRYAFPV